MFWYCCSQNNYRVAIAQVTLEHFAAKWQVKGKVRDCPSHTVLLHHGHLHPHTHTPHTCTYTPIHPHPPTPTPACTPTLTHLHSHTHTCTQINTWSLALLLPTDLTETLLGSFKGSPCGRGQQRGQSTSVALSVHQQCSLLSQAIRKLKEELVKLSKSIPYIGE